jgi:drug/metabolite transporter (DMT)-like permease
MIAVVLAAVAGFSYGASDFSGAVASKRTSSMVITAATQLVSLIVVLAVLVAVPEDDRHLVDLAWGALGGLGAAAALVCFYKALAIGPMSQAAALTALVGTVVPVAVGLVLGERPSVTTLVGMGLCVPAAVLVSAGSATQGETAMLRTPRERVAMLEHAASTRRLAVVAGLGFGLFFVALSRSSADSGLFPLVGARTASVLALAAVLTTRRGWEPIVRRSWVPVIAAGVFDCLASSSYLLAVGRGQLGWVAAISSLYPVSTVLLARVVLKEKLGPLQLVGLVLSAAALALVAIGR